MNKIILFLCLLIFLMAWVGFSDIIKCPYKTLTGSPCLFCGTLTSLSHILHGRIKEAWEANPIGVLGFLVLVVILLYNILHWQANVLQKLPERITVHDIKVAPHLYPLPSGGEGRVRGLILGKFL